MTLAPSLRKLGKRPGKQIRDAAAIWASTPAWCDDRASGGLVLSFGAVRLGTFEARYMPKVALRPLRHAFCCFPPASPAFRSGAGTQKRPRRTALNH